MGMIFGRWKTGRIYHLLARNLGEAGLLEIEMDLVLVGDLNLTNILGMV